MSLFLPLSLPGLSLPLSLYSILHPSHCLSLSLSVSHTHTLSLSLTHTHTLSLSLSLSSQSTFKFICFLLCVFVTVCLVCLSLSQCISFYPLFLHPFSLSHYQSPFSLSLSLSLSSQSTFKFICFLLCVTHQSLSLSPSLLPINI